MKKSTKFIKDINDIAKHLRNYPEVCLKFSKLDKCNLHLLVYSDASFATNTDKLSQLGYIMFLLVRNNQCQLLYRNTYKEQLVNRFVLGSEVIALTDAFNMLYTVKFDLQSACTRAKPLTMITDSLPLFDILTKTSVTTEKHLMTDVKTVKLVQK